MDKIINTPMKELLSEINDPMITELYSRTQSHMLDVVSDVMLTLPMPNPNSLTKFSEDTLKEFMFDECVEVLQKLTGDNRTIDNFPNTKKLIDTAVSKSIYKERGVKLGLPFARWVWKEKLTNRLSEVIVRLYIVGLYHTGQINLKIS